MTRLLNAAIAAMIFCALLTGGGVADSGLATPSVTCRTTMHVFVLVQEEVPEGMPFSWSLQPAAERYTLFVTLDRSVGTLAYVFDDRGCFARLDDLPPIPTAPPPIASPQLPAIAATPA